MTAALSSQTRRACAEELISARARRDLPSLVGAVFRRGAPVWQESLGDTGGQYRIGSITKTITAVAVLQLRDEGRLELADPVRRHVPDAPYGARSIRSLLSHGSGMTAEPAGSWWERSPGRGWAELVADNAAAHQVFAAGQRYHYSNLSFAILGELVARLRGGAWFDAVHQRILRPLGLDETTYHSRPGAARGTSRDPRDARLMAEPAFDSGAMAPAGQLWSTVRDLARWGDFLVTGDDAVLAPATLTEMRTMQSADPDTQHEGGYGLGLRLRWRPTSALVGHTGSMPGFLAAVFTDPGTRVGAVILTNATTGLEPEALAARLVDLAEPDLVSTDLAATEGTAEAATPLPVAQELAGDWFWGNTRMTLEPTADGFALVGDGATRRFVHEGPDRFRGCDGYFAGEVFEVVRRGEAISHLQVVTFVLTRVPYDPAAPIPGGPPTPLD